MRGLFKRPNETTLAHSSNRNLPVKTTDYLVFNYETLLLKAKTSSVRGEPTKLPSKCTENYFHFYVSWYLIYLRNRDWNLLMRWTWRNRNWQERNKRHCTSAELDRYVLEKFDKLCQLQLPPTLLTAERNSVELALNVVLRNLGHTVENFAVWARIKAAKPLLIWSRYL